jgi:thiamine-monophosphate kinase
MIDVSDGLLRDLGHVCRASACRQRSISLHSDRARPRGSRFDASRAGNAAALDYALAGGDDYELLFTTRPGASEAKVRRVCEKLECVVSPIGVMTHAARTPHVTDGEGRRLGLDGYSHFQRRS